MPEATDIATARIETDYTALPMCPHCGAAYREPYDLFDPSDEITETDCGSCCKPMVVVRHVAVEYSTRKVDSKTDE